MYANIKEDQEFKYIEEGNGEVLLLLHGLFGALSNWEHVLAQFSKQYRVIIPMLPIYEMPIKQANLEGLLAFVTAFIQRKALKNPIVIGNSLGGHIALMYTLQHPEQVQKLVLTASSGLYENTLGGSFPKRGNYAYIADRVRYTFFNPQTVSQAYIDEVFSVTKNIPKALRVVSIAKSAQRNNLAHMLPKIQANTLLIWGLNDTITPPLVAHEFNALLPHATLRFIDKCCHAPMMEHPQKFNALLGQFLQDTT
ncbi:MAG: alpha/beta fold hydrolase [Bacteroidota bacterium]